MTSVRQEEGGELVRTLLNTSKTQWLLNLTLPVCVADIQEDEILFTIPRRVVMNMNNALPVLPAGPMQEAITAMPSWLVCNIPSEFTKATH